MKNEHSTVAYTRKVGPNIPTSFIEQNPDGVVLLTDEAFTVFLPAWLTCAIEKDKVREMMVYTFSGDFERNPPIG